MDREAMEHDFRTPQRVCPGRISTAHRTESSPQTAATPDQPNTHRAADPEYSPAPRLPPASSPLTSQRQTPSHRFANPASPSREIPRTSHGRQHVQRRSEQLTSPQHRLSPSPARPRDRESSEDRHPSSSSPSWRQLSSQGSGGGARVRKSSPSGNSPDEDRRRCQRDKQISFGYATDGYHNMERLIEHDPLLRSGGLLPLSPPTIGKGSKRIWDIQLRKWRRALHMFDYVFIDGQDDPATQATVLEQQRQQWVSEAFQEVPRAQRRRISLEDLLQVQHTTAVPTKIPVEEDLRSILRRDDCYESVRSVVPQSASSLTKGTDISPLEAGIKIHIAPSSAVLQRQQAQMELQQRLTSQQHQQHSLTSACESTPRRDSSSAAPLQQQQQPSIPSRAEARSPSPRPPLFPPPPPLPTFAAHQTATANTANAYSRGAAHLCDFPAATAPSNRPQERRQKEASHRQSRSGDAGQHENVPAPKPNRTLSQVPDEKARSYPIHPSSCSASAAENSDGSSTLYGGQHGVSASPQAPSSSSVPSSQSRVRESVPTVVVPASTSNTADLPLPSAFVGFSQQPHPSTSPFACSPSVSAPPTQPAMAWTPVNVHQPGLYHFLASAPWSDPTAAPCGFFPEKVPQVSHPNATMPIDPKVVMMRMSLPSAAPGAPWTPLQPQEQQQQQQQAFYIDPANATAMMAPLGTFRTTDVLPAGPRRSPNARPDEEGSPAPPHRLSGSGNLGLHRHHGSSGNRNKKSTTPSHFFRGADGGNEGMTAFTAPPSDRVRNPWEGRRHSATAGAAGAATAANMPATRPMNTPHPVPRFVARLSVSSSERRLGEQQQQEQQQQQQRKDEVPGKGSMTNEESKRDDAVYSVKEHSFAPSSDASPEMPLAECSQTLSDATPDRMLFDAFATAKEAATTEARLFQPKRTPDESSSTAYDAVGESRHAAADKDDGDATVTASPHLRDSE